MKNKNKLFDYLIIGAGWGGLSQAALHAKDGKKICILEAYDRPGGYGHSFTKDGYSFCAEMQYMQECQPGWKVYQFLKQLGLEKEIEFNLLNPNCFDKVVIPGANFEIPLGVDNFKLKLIENFPNDEDGIEKYFRIMRKITEEINPFTEIISLQKVITSPFKHLSLLRFATWTLQDFFNYLKLSKPVQAILSAQVGDVALSPKYVSMAAYSHIVIGYGSSASFPKKGMGFVIRRIEKFIKDYGGEIYYNSKVTEMNTNKNTITKIKTEDGKIFRAKNYISNIDPNKTFKIVKGEKLNPWFQSTVKYKYSCSCFSIFLGVKGINIKKFGFGKWNIWHFPSQDTDAVLDAMYETQSYEAPFLFISTPSLYANEGFLTPDNDSYTIQIVTVGDYHYFKKIFNEDRKKYQVEVERIEKEILDYTEKNFIPNLRNFIQTKEVWSPIDLAKKIGSPYGNIYGPELSPLNIAFNRVSQQTPVKNLYLVGATTGFPGLLGVITGSMQLYEKLKKKENECKM